MLMVATRIVQSGGRFVTDWRHVLPRHLVTSFPDQGKWPGNEVAAVKCVLAEPHSHHLALISSGM